MNIKYLSLIPFFSSAIFLASCSTGSGIERILAPGAQLEKLAAGFAFTEGPAADAAGNVFFTDQPNDRIMRWSTDGELSVWQQPSARSNGLFFDTEGFLWACADEHTELRRTSPGGHVAVVLPGIAGQHINGPNDLWIHPGGKIFFTDPFYPRPWWEYSTQPQPVQGVYCFDPANGAVTLIINDLVKPNGIIGSEDGKILYVADIGASITWRYAIQPDGSVTGKSLFCEMGSDGMTVDSKGNVYLTGKGVTIFDNQGQKIGNIDVPEPWTANVCFGGASRNELFITASTTIYRIKMKYKGVYLPRKS